MVKQQIVDFAYAVRDYLVFDKANDISKCFIDNVDNNHIKKDIFLSSLSELKKELKLDLDFFFESDPAAFSKEEIILAYPGYFAITLYRIAHQLYCLDYELAARIITEEAHKSTGIDIHPGAKIKTPFFIDHGTGIVIGQTCEIGKRVKIYQGVTLGALSLGRGRLIKGEKRHPTIKDNVTIYAGASILGGETIIGENVVIGSNVFLLESVPDNNKVIISKPKLILIPKNKK